MRSSVSDGSSGYFCSSSASLASWPLNCAGRNPRMTLPDLGPSESARMFRLDRRHGARVAAGWLCGAAKRCQTMRDSEFGTWLEQRYRKRNGDALQARPRGDARSRCKRVERYTGDLDSFFTQDEMQGLLQALSYSRADNSSGISPQHNVPIDGDVVNGTASLRNAINLYRQFCMDCRNISTRGGEADEASSGTAS
jgi:hypothetical protein